MSMLDRIKERERESGTRIMIKRFTHADWLVNHIIKSRGGMSLVELLPFLKEYDNNLIPYTPRIEFYYNPRSRTIEILDDPSGYSYMAITESMDDIQLLGDIAYLCNEYIKKE